MQAQGLIVALLVIGCSLHAAWRLMPAAWRKTLAGRLLHRELATSTGCAGGCDGCGSAAPATPAPDAAKPLIFHPRRAR